MTRTLLTILLLAIQSVAFARLGETEEQCATHYGKPLERTPIQNELGDLYCRYADTEGCQLRVLFKGGRAVQITLARDHGIPPAVVAKALEENSEGFKWNRDLAADRPEHPDYRFYVRDDYKYTAEYLMRGKTFGDDAMFTTLILQVLKKAGTKEVQREAFTLSVPDDWVNDLSFSKVDEKRTALLKSPGGECHCTITSTKIPDQNTRHGYLATVSADAAKAQSNLNNVKPLTVATQGDEKNAFGFSGKGLVPVQVFYFVYEGKENYVVLEAYCMADSVEKFLPTLAKIRASVKVR